MKYTSAPAHITLSGRQQLQLFLGGSDGFLLSLLNPGIRAFSGEGRKQEDEKSPSEVGITNVSCRAELRVQHLLSGL